jgi:hypothetical protein
MILGTDFTTLEIIVVFGICTVKLAGLWVGERYDCAMLLDTHKSMLGRLARAGA